jgi:hypothetical protein
MDQGSNQLNFSAQYFIHVDCDMFKNIVPLCKGEVFELSLLIKIYTYIFMIASSILLQNVLTQNLNSNLYACCLQPLLCVFFFW